jgi:isopentenyldiphosphate isomerase
MTIYRVTFHIDLLVDCENEQDAKWIGYKNLPDEVRNYSLTTIPWSIRRVESAGELRREEHGSLPWRDPPGREEPEFTVDELLGGKYG